MSNLAKHFANLFSEKRVFLFHVIARDKYDAVQTSLNLYGSASNIFSSWLVQEQYWFLARFHQESPFYNILTLGHSCKHLDIAGLECCLLGGGLHHHILSTTFTLIDGRPIQCITLSPNVPLLIIDLCELLEHDRETTVQPLSREESRYPLELTRGLLRYPRLLHLTKDEHVLLVVIHNIISDDWLTRLFFRELVILYNTVLCKRSNSLSRLAFQYTVLAYWQPGWPQERVLDEQLIHLKQYLPHLLLLLSTNWVRPVVRTLHNTLWAFMLSLSFAPILEVLSYREGMTFESLDFNWDVKEFRGCKLECIYPVMHGLLWVAWKYDSNIYRHTMIASLAQNYLETLRSSLTISRGTDHAKGALCLENL